MPFIPVAGTRLFYTESGPATGRPMLLLHAALQTSESMEPLRELLAPLGLRLITVDLRGHGRTANPTRSLSVLQLADDMVALMTHLGLERPLLAGYSLGGIVAIELARRGLADGLVVLASRIRPARRGRETFDPANIRARSPLWAQQPSGEACRAGLGGAGGRPGRTADHLARLQPCGVGPHQHPRPGGAGRQGPDGLARPGAGPDGSGAWRQAAGGAPGRTPRIALPQRRHERRLRICEGSPLLIGLHRQKRESTIKDDSFS